MPKEKHRPDIPAVGMPGAPEYVPLLSGLLLAPKRAMMVLENFAHDRQREATIQSIRKLYEDAVRAGASNFAMLHNVSLYVLLFDEDLSAYSQDYFLANTNRRHRFVARHLASLIYEGTQDLPSLIGGDYRRALAAVEFPGEWQKELNSISAAFNLFKRQHSPSLQDIRNIVGAHKDEDVAKQLAILDKVNPLTVYRLGAEFSEPLRSLLNFQTRVTLHLTNSRVMLKEVARHLPAAPLTQER